MFIMMHVLPRQMQYVIESYLWLLLILFQDKVFKEYSVDGVLGK